MKKLFFVVSCALMSVGAFAQDAFIPTWNLGVRGGAILTAGESDWHNLVSPTAQITAGYQFTPVFGLRAAASAWQGKGALPALSEQGLYQFSSSNLHLDAMFDLCNLFGKDRQDRGVNPYIFAGIGGNYRFNNDEAQELKASFPADNWLWDGKVLSFCGRVGAGIDFRLCDAVAFSIEIADNMLSDKFNSKNGDSELFGKKVDFDYQLAALAGFKFNLGLGKKRAAAAASAAAADAAAAQAAAKAAADKAAAEKAAAEKAAADKAAAEKAAAEKAAADKAAAEAARAAARASVENVYFTINKSVINASETAKIQKIVSIMKNYPEAVVSITGYADKNTGTAKRNLVLSQERAAAVSKALVDAGVAQDRITVNYYGDTKQVSEVIEENRVSVCVTR